VQFTSETTALLKSIMPLHVEPDTPVFTNVDGEPIEPKVFSTHWYNCLRALGIRTRGLYCTKDTFCSLAVTRGVIPSWLEQQTGVALGDAQEALREVHSRSGSGRVRRDDRGIAELFSRENAPFCPS